MLLCQATLHMALTALLSSRGGEGGGEDDDEVVVVEEGGGGEQEGLLRPDEALSMALAAVCNAIDTCEQLVVGVGVAVAA